MSDTVEDRLYRLEAVAEIKELTARYCWHVARGEGDKVAGLFTDDAVFDGSGSGIGVISGQAALAEFYTRSVSQPGFAFPFIHNHIVHVDGDRATGSCALEAIFRRDDDSVRQAGYYLDTYRRVDGRWLFAERKLFFLARH